MPRGYWTESGFVESKGIPLITWQNISSDNDIICGNDAAKLEAVPFNPSQQLTHYHCKKCKRIITTDNIVDAFLSTEITIEQEIPIAILFHDGTVLIESTEFEGESRCTAKRKLLSKDSIENIIDLFRDEMEKILDVSLVRLTDLFQT